MGNMDEKEWKVDLIKTCHSMYEIINEINNYLTQDPAVPLLKIHPYVYYTDICLNTFVAAIFIASRS